ncbi:MAG TPA: DUF3488 and transglutaminase-like domain-containing protein [Pyrinomonadaceae bacterium]
MTFDTWFRASSYATVACGAAALVVVGGVGWATTLVFAALLALAWSLEGKRWQLSERAGLLVVLVSLPLFYLDWQYQEAAAGGVEAGAGLAALKHLTLFLSAVKLLQVKSDRDWLFLYLVAFFEVLLAAGLSVSPLFLVALAAYLFCALLSVVCFELRKARRAAAPDARVRVTFDSARRRRDATADGVAQALRRLPAVALCLLALVFALALPIFFVTPRLGTRASSLGNVGPTAQVGFSDQVTLGDFGRIQKSDRLVMRVSVGGAQAVGSQPLRWRGVSLDHFDGQTWRRSSGESQEVTGGESDFFPLGTTEHLGRLTTQTFFVEPLDTAVLFAAPRVVAVEGALDFVRSYKDGGALTTRPHPRERISYRAYSDTVEQAAAALRADDRRYPRARTPNLQAPIENYLRYPAELDAGVVSLAWHVANLAGARSRYDMARAIESHLGRNEYGGAYSYSLETRGGGDDPLADFLFNVRAGHCEYFSTAMAVMLRTQGVAARVVNGFQAGEYNAAAGAFFVRQYDAHSWVEVYFPETDSWVAFDPTPAAGRPGAGASASFGARLMKYAEALELFWIRYVIAYDSREQQTIASSIRDSFSSLRRAVAATAAGLGTRLSSIWGGRETRDGVGTAGAGFPLVRTLVAVAAVGLLLLVFVRRWLKARGERERVGAQGGGASAVDFYERMATALDARGLRRPTHQTPLEFASATGVPEALTITKAYHRVRFGAQSLSPAEAAEVERCLRQLEGEEPSIVNRNRQSSIDSTDDASDISNHDAYSRR